MNDYFSQFNQAVGTYTGITIASYVVALLILVVFFVLAQITNFIFNKLFKFFAKKTENDVDDRIIKMLNMPIFYSVVLVGAYQSFGYIGILEQYSGDFEKIIKSLVIAVWTFAIAKILSLSISELGFKFAEKTKSTLDDELMPLFQKLSSIIVYFAGLMLLLGIWNFDITPFLASAGIAGFVIAFAAQDTISHLFGGISIYFDKPFKVGDRIQLESGEIGDVLEIGMRSTRIKTFDETVVIMPNSKIASAKIINYNQPGEKTKEKVNIKVAYDSDIEKVKKVILEVAGETEGVEKTPSPSVYFSDIGDYALEFLLITWVSSPRKKFVVRARLNEGLIKRFRKENIQMPYPAQDIYVKK